MHVNHPAIGPDGRTLCREERLAVELIRLEAVEPPADASEHDYMTWARRVGDAFRELYRACGGAGAALDAHYSWASTFGDYCTD